MSNVLTSIGSSELNAVKDKDEKRVKFLNLPKEEEKLEKGEFDVTENEDNIIKKNRFKEKDENNIKEVLKQALNEEDEFDSCIPVIEKNKQGEKKKKTKLL